MSGLSDAIGMSADEQLLADVRALGHEFLDEARKILRTGTPNTKATLIRTVVAPLIRSAMAEDDTSNEKALAAMRDQLDALHQVVRAGIGKQVVSDPEWDVPPEDGPG